jgi:hypothetical protein
MLSPKCFGKKSGHVIPGGWCGYRLLIAFTLGIPRTVLVLLTGDVYEDLELGYEPSWAQMSLQTRRLCPKQNADLHLT